MEIPTFDPEIFNPENFIAASADYLAGAFLITIPSSRAGDMDFRLYAKSAGEIMARLNPSDSDLEASLVAQEQRLMAARGSAAGVCFLEVLVGSVNQSLRSDAPNTDTYHLSNSDHVNSGELADIAHYYFVLYDVQEKFRVPGGVTLTALDIPKTEVKERLQGFYSLLLNTAHSLDEWSLSAKSLKAFLPEKHFGFCAAELVSLSLQSASTARDEKAAQLYGISLSIIERHYQYDVNMHLDKPE